MPQCADVSDGDRVRPFQFVRSPVRGRAARLSETLRRLLEKRGHPPAVEPVIAEASALAALVGQLIHPGLKFPTEIRSGGPLGLFAADCLAPAEPGDPASRSVEPGSQDWRGSGIVIQGTADGKTRPSGRIPLETGRNPDGWVDAAERLAPVDPLELTGPSRSMPQTLPRLFRRQHPRAGRFQPVEFSCACHRKRFGRGFQFIQPKTSQR